MQKYVECSSKTGEGVNKVFEEAVMAVLQKRLIIAKEAKVRPCLCMF
jgi:GTPase SAR1 family protein